MKKKLWLRLARLRLMALTIILLLGSGCASALSDLAAPNQAETAAQTATPTPQPPSLLWRQGGAVDGQDGDWHYSLFGVDVAPNGMIYAAAGPDGLLAFDKDGGRIELPGELAVPRQIDQVQIGPDGKIYTITRSEENRISVYSPDGALLYTFGTAGTGGGQFGAAGSPEDITVGLDGKIYALDTQELETGGLAERIHIYEPQGNFVATINLADVLNTEPEPNANFGVAGIDIGIGGNLYVIGTNAKMILVFSPNGILANQLTPKALAEVSPRSLDIDDRGNLYLVTQGPPSVLKLDPAGRLVGQFGEPAASGDSGWPEGQLFLPTGAAALPDGASIFVIDGSLDFSYLTAFEFR